MEDVGWTEAEDEEIEVQSNDEEESAKENYVIVIG